MYTHSPPRAIQRRAQLIVTVSNVVIARVFNDSPASRRRRYPPPPSPRPRSNSGMAVLYKIPLFVVPATNMVVGGRLYGCGDVVYVNKRPGCYSVVEVNRNQSAVDGWEEAVSSFRVLERSSGRGRLLTVRVVSH